jgi:hypothetical protein
MRLHVALFLVLALCLVSLPAVAQVDLYDDGPTDGTTDAWTINFGFAVSDQFTLSSAAPSKWFAACRVAVPGRCYRIHRHLDHL